MRYIESALNGLILLENEVYGDERGYFTENFNQRQFEELTGEKRTFVQDNLSQSHEGVLRGLHYQVPPMAQAKLVRCVAGVVWDVAVDLRRSSQTFGSWFGVELSEGNARQLWIPEGFAHGFLALTEPAVLVYKTTEYYSPKHDRSIRWDDPQLGIHWPLTSEPTLSAKDAAAPSLQDADLFP